MLHYRNIPCEKLTEDEIIKCANLFSENYGIWSQAIENPSKIGKQIKLSPNRFKEMYVNKKDRYVSLVYNDDEIIGQAFYLRRKLFSFKKLKNKYVTFVLQLVLKKEWWGQKIGAKLLHSIWGLSDNYAWGLFTSNPRTISALENATLRNIDTNLLKKRIDKIKMVLADVFEDTKWIDTMHECCVDTDFPVDHSKIQYRIEDEYTKQKRDFPFKRMIKAKEEWLAFVFQSQKTRKLTDKELENLTETSQSILQDAYSKMNLNTQAWTYHTETEINYLLTKNFIKEGDSILDLGCGNGRHVIELRKKRFNAIGVDFSKQIEKNLGECPERSYFEIADLLTYKTQEKYDVVLCLYDVIGSYSDDDKNKQIVKTISKCLKPNGIAIVSVMNMHLTQKQCKNCVTKIEENIDKLMKLQPSRKMQNTGDVFDGKYLLIDDATGIVYHKEQFFQENNLPVEYIVSEKRYKKDELKILFKSYNCREITFVQAGHWDSPLEAESKKAKEILAIFQKKESIFSRVLCLFQRVLSLFQEK